MRKTISGMVAAVAVMMTMGAAPAMACYANPCAPAPVYVAPAYSGCYTGCGWATERLPDPVHQYYYVNQGPTYSGPGNWAPRPVYQETSVSYGRPYYDGYRARPHYGYRYSVRPSVRYGYAPRLGYAPRMGYAPRLGYAPRHGYMPRHSMRHHGAMMHRHEGHQGHRSHVLRRYN
ncbi:MAG: hypothetical protein Q7U92_06525 [Bradyrhizobium sp.]|nr:hypothetical protein [Bradyrhizobium sp.]